MKKIFFVLIIMIGTLLTGCKKANFQEVEIELKAIDIKKITFLNGSTSVELEYPFESDTLDIITKIINHISSLTFYEEIIDEGNCDGGNTVIYHLYTEQGDHFKLYTISASNKDKCTSYLVIRKNDEILGYSETGSQTLYDLFLTL